eukprot:714144_1
MLPEAPANTISPIRPTWQNLLFPKRALIYHESTRQRIMSHVHLRRRNTRSHPYAGEDDEKQDVHRTAQSLTDELNESDMNVEELLISEFKLMNLEMRREIRSLYRLLIIFVVIVIGMAVGGILFVGDFIKNVSDFHAAVFKPQSVQNPEWVMWYKSVSTTFSDIKQSVDFFSYQYHKWSPIIAWNTSDLNVAVNPFINQSIPNEPIISEEDLLSELLMCDRCVTQLDEDSVAGRNLFATLKFIQNRANANQTLSMPDIVGTGFFSYPVLNTVCGLAKQLRRDLWSRMRATEAWAWLVPPPEEGNNDVILTKLIKNVVEIISTAPRCETAYNIKQKISMAIAFIMDIPLGTVMESQNINQILDAKSVITFPYKQLMCGDVDAISALYHDVLSTNHSSHYHFMTLDLDKNENQNVDIPIHSLKQNSSV